MFPSTVVYRQKTSSGTAIFLFNSKERNPVVNFVESSLDEKDEITFQTNISACTV